MANWQKLLSVASFACLVSLQASAYDRVQPADVTEIRTSPGQITYFTGGGPPSPVGLVRSGPDSFLSADWLGRRLICIDLSRKSVSAADLGTTQQEISQSSMLLPWFSNTIVGGGTPSRLVGFDTVTRTQVFEFSMSQLWGGREVRDRASPTGGRGDFLVIRNTLFFRDNERQIRAISGRGALINHAGAVELMDTVDGDPERYWSQVEPEVAEENRRLRDSGEHYVIGGRYYTTVFAELEQYLDAIGNPSAAAASSDQRSYRDVVGALPLIGYDEEANSYWGAGPELLVLSPLGQTLASFSVVPQVRESGGDFHTVGWHVDPDGTAWLLAFETDAAGQAGTLFVYRFDSVASANYR